MRFSRTTMAFHWMLLLTIIHMNQKFAYSYSYRFSTGGSFTMPKEDPYKVLGVPLQANGDAIKKAYRQLAKEAHPDKNPNLDPDVASENFRRIVDAFDFLSDPKKRKQYDAMRIKQIRREQENARRMEQQRKQRERIQRQKEQELRRQKQDLLSKAREAQKKMMQYSTLEQLKSDMLDRKGLYKRNFLCVFVGNKKSEKFAQDELLFPYPFAGKGVNDILWDDILQTAKVRYNKRTPLVDAFNLNAALNLHIIFAKKGDPIDKYHTFKASHHGNQRSQFETWVSNKLKASVTFVNRHHAKIVVYLVSGKKVEQIVDLDSGYEITVTLKSGDQVISVDSRLDRIDKYSSIGAKRNINHNNYENAILGKYTISSTERIEINSKRCIDMSTRCLSWVDGFGFDECTKNAEIMHNICPATCGVCGDHPLSAISYYLFHYPIAWLPAGVDEIVEFLRVYTMDMENVLSYRRNVALIFFSAGLLMSLIFSLLLLDYVTRKQQNEANGGLSWGKSILFLLYLVLGTACHSVLTRPPKTSTWLWTFQSDLQNMLAFQKDAMFFLFLFGVAQYQILPLFFWAITDQPRKPDENRARYTIVIIVTLSIFVGAAGIALFLIILNSNRISRWYRIWLFQKNAACAILLVGFTCGIPLGSAGHFFARFRGTICYALFYLAVVWYLISTDDSLRADYEHVINFRKNAMFTAGLFGSLVGAVLANIITDSSQNNTATKKKQTEDRVRCSRKRVSK